MTLNMKAHSITIKHDNGIMTVVTEHFYAESHCVNSAKMIQFVSNAV